MHPISWLTDVVSAIIPKMGRNLFKFTPRLRQSHFKLYSKIIWFGLALLLSCLIGFILPYLSRVDATNSPITIQLPLSTRGAKILDAGGESVLLRGINWFGIETEMHAPHGLWKRDYKEMLAQIKTLGYNTIRLPYSVASLRSSVIAGIDYSIGANADFQGKSPLEMMDLLIQEAERQGLMILLDSHRLNDKSIPELWYGDGFTEKDWIDTWKMLAKRYKNQLNVIGADLKNEPHGKASWGTNDRATDWRLAAERAGNEILAINPNWLIVVEGVEKNVPGQKLPIHWMGGNLEGVARFPVRLSRPNKLVYSPHEYGPGVFNQPWFSDPKFPANLYSRWEIAWNYIATKGIAPIYIGEFGGRQVDGNSKEGKWQQNLVYFVQKKGLSFTYWSWNPNSDDTGGILLDDWLTVDRSKQQLLQGVLIATNFSHTIATNPNPFPVVINPTPTPTPSPIVINPTPTPNPSPIVINPTPTPNPIAINPIPKLPLPSQRLKIISYTPSDWQAGFCTSIQVVNEGNNSVRDWQVSFQMNQAAINQIWSGNFTRQGSQYVVTPLDWARMIEPGQTREFGFCANKQGGDYQPQQISPQVIGLTSKSQPNSIVSTNPKSQLKAAATMQSDWQDGFCMNLQVTNHGNSKVNDWELKFQMEDAAINNSWNGNFQHEGSEYVVTPMDWGRVIQPRQTRDLGFYANKLGTNYQPRQISIAAY